MVVLCLKAESPSSRRILGYGECSLPSLSLSPCSRVPHSHCFKWSPSCQHQPSSAYPLSKPHTQQPAQQCWGHLSQAGACKVVAQTIHGSLALSCMPQSSHYNIPLMAPEAPPSISADLATSGWASLGMATSPLLQLPPYSGV